MLQRLSTSTCTSTRCRYNAEKKECCARRGGEKNNKKIIIARKGRENGKGDGECLQEEGKKKKLKCWGRQSHLAPGAVPHTCGAVQPRPADARILPCSAHSSLWDLGQENHPLPPSLLFCAASGGSVGPRSLQTSCDGWVCRIPHSCRSYPGFLSDSTKSLSIHVT